MSAWSDVDWNGPGRRSIASVAMARAFLTRCRSRPLSSGISGFLHFGMVVAGRSVEADLLAGPPCNFDRCLREVRFRRSVSLGASHAHELAGDAIGAIAVRSHQLVSFSDPKPPAGLPSSVERPEHGADPSTPRPETQKAPPERGPSSGRKRPRRAPTVSIG